MMKKLTALILLLLLVLTACGSSDSATEETMVEQHQSFWKYLETLKKNKEE